MSQLNNEENNIEINETNNNVKSKMKTRTKIIIFLLIFTIIAVGITTAAIIYTNQSTDEVVPQTSDVPNSTTVVPEPVEVVSDGLGIKSLTEQYNENDLKISEFTEKKGTRIPTSQWDTNTYKMYINYIQIDGLKDASIESQINNEIKNLVYSLCSDDELNNEEINMINISASCSANFSNALSITVDKTIYYTDSNKQFYSEDHWLNYNLVTGEAIAFRDLFTNASIRNALNQSVYDTLLYNYTYDAMDENNEFLIDMSKADLSTLEDETYITVNKIMNNLDNIKFNFGPSYINCMVGDTSIYLETTKIHQNIAIYNRFKTQNSIFDGTYEGQKNIFVFTDRYVSDFVQFTQYEDVFDNLRIEAHIDFSGYGTNSTEFLSNSNVQKAINDCISKVKDEISSIEKKARENPDKAYIYCAEYSVGTNTDRDLDKLNIEHQMVYTSGISYIYEMSKTYYDETYYAKIGEFYRKDLPAVRYIFVDYPEEDNPIFTRESFDTHEEFDIYTGKTKDELLDEYYEKQQEHFSNITITENQQQIELPSAENIIP